VVNTDEWTRGWSEPWKSIARLLMFPSAFLFKAWRDYISPALSSAVDSVKRYFDGAVAGIFDAIRNAFSPIFDPLKRFADTVYDFFTKTMPGFVKNAVDFFTSLPGRIGDFVSWIVEEFGRGWGAVVSFFTKTLPDWLNAARNSWLIYQIK